MYPSTFFGLFPPFPRDARAFVAMSFDPRFDPRWRDVIAPAVRAVLVNDRPLEPVRVDLRKVSDSILTDILDGIARCRVIVADISSIGEIGGRAVRNANVMYELGLAHAVRQAEEVLVFRSDDREMLFDIANVRVHRYDPDGAPDVARQLVSQTIAETLREVDLKKGLAVRAVAQSLAFPSWIALMDARQQAFHHPSTRTMGEVVGSIARGQAIGRLLEVGAIQADLVRVSPELLKDDKGPVEQLVTYKSLFTRICTDPCWDAGVEMRGASAPEVLDLLT
jgi:hypothetical protein